MQALKPDLSCTEMLKGRWQESPTDKQKAGKRKRNQRKGRQKSWTPIARRGMRDRWGHREGGLPYLAGWLGTILHRY